MLLGKAGEQKDTLVGVRPNGLEDTPQLAMTVDRVQAQSMGLSLSDVYTAIQLMLAPVYVERLRLRRPRAARQHAGRCARSARNPDALSHFYVPSSTTARRCIRRRPTTTHSAAALDPMIPLSNVVQTKWKIGSPSLVRYNGYEAIDIVGSKRQNKSTGEAMAAMQDIIKRTAGRLRLRLDRPVVAGNPLRQPGADAVRVVDPGRVPVPGRAVRKLVDSGRGACWSSRSA